MMCSKNSRMSMLHFNNHFTEKSMPPIIALTYSRGLNWGQTVTIAKYNMSFFVDLAFIVMRKYIAVQHCPR